jgi:hypothetical protein
MPQGGKRHRLILYTYILNRWWQAIMDVGVILLVLVAAIKWLPSYLPIFTPPQIADWVLWFTTGAGAFAILLGIFMVSIRKSAYVQPFEDHMRLATPFFRMDISYRRFSLVTNDDMDRLFPLDKYKGRKREFTRPLTKHTAVILELTGWPVPRVVLNQFLSPYFFPDKTPRLALLVPDWIRFSTELESFRGAWLHSLRHTTSTPQSDLLASLSGKK